MGPPSPLTSPWTQRMENSIGLATTVVVEFDETTRVISTVTLTREVGCQFTHVLFGVGTTGVPDDTPYSYFVPEGETVLTGEQFAVIPAPPEPLTTAEQIDAIQITAGL
jgi:hypothetical protein